MSLFLNRPGVKLELSRACIHKDYRTGPVMQLLWRGVVQYLREVKADQLFGLSSIKTTDPKEAALISAYLTERGVVSRDLNVIALPAHRMDLDDSSVPKEALFTAKALLPPLMSSYLKAGAKVHGAPALDRLFRCIDFFTVLEMGELSAMFERKFAVC